MTKYIITSTTDGSPYAKANGISRTVQWEVTTDNIERELRTHLVYATSGAGNMPTRGDVRITVEVVE